MLKPKNSRFIFHFFRLYTGWIIRRHFHKVHISSVEIDPEKPVMLLCNHFSWWDGFLMWHITRKMLGYQFHVMVLEQTLRQQWFMRFLGAFSMPEKGRGQLASLHYAASLLRQNRQAILLFPQGKIHSNFIGRVAFKKGIWQIAAMAGHHFQYVFSTVHAENLQHKRPSVWISLSVHQASAFTSAAELEEAYNRHYLLNRKKQEQYQA